MAFILKSIKFPAGSDDLASDIATLKTINIVKHALPEHTSVPSADDGVDATCASAKGSIDVTSV